MLHTVYLPGDGQAKLSVVVKFSYSAAETKLNGAGSMVETQLSKFIVSL
jgi:hypothetical protein